MLYFVFHLLLNSSSFFIHFIQNIIKKRMFQPIDLSPGDLLYYGGVEWLNISDFLGKIKKVQIVCTVNEMIRQFIFMFLAVLLVMITPTNFWKKVKTNSFIKYCYSFFLFFIYLLHPGVQKRTFIRSFSFRVWSFMRCALSSNQQWFFSAKKDFVKRKNPSS